MLEAVLAAHVLFRFQDPRIDESSALVAAAAGDWLYTVNDSGDRARVFAVDERGRTLATLSLPGVTAVDTESAAAGPGGTLYVGDIGDNRARRPDVQVHVVAEPRLDPGRRGVVLRAPAPRTATLTYEDGAHDAETLLVHPRTGLVLVVTKDPAGSVVYAAPQPLGDGTLRRVAPLPLPVPDANGASLLDAVKARLVTDGAVSPDGRRIALRTYTAAYVYEVPGDDLAAGLAGTPTVVPLPRSRQGEGITWSRDGTALLTSSEGVHAPVSEVPAPAAAPPVARVVPAAPASREPLGWRTGALVAGVLVAGAASAAGVLRGRARRQ